MSECGECERNVYQGHAPDCSRRCQAMHSNGANLLQCERRSAHDGNHGAYGPEEDDGLVYEWPAAILDPANPSTTPKETR